jgi:hypothetical protein
VDNFITETSKEADERTSECGVNPQAGKWQSGFLCFIRAVYDKCEDGSKRIVKIMLALYACVCVVYPDERPMVISRATLSFCCKITILID